MAAKKSGSPTYDFVLAELRKNPNVSFADVRAKGEKKGLAKIYPIVYGRAKKALGLAGGNKARTTRKASRKKATRKTRTTRAPRATGRRTTAASSVSAGVMGDFASVIDAMKQNEVERERYRQALEQIRDVIDAALADS